MQTSDHQPLVAQPVYLTTRILSGTSFNADKIDVNTNNMNA